MKNGTFIFLMVVAMLLLMTTTGIVMKHQHDKETKEEKEIVASDDCDTVPVLFDNITYTDCTEDVCVIGYDEGDVTLDIFCTQEQMRLYQDFEYRYGLNEDSLSKDSVRKEFDTCFSYVYDNGNYKLIGR